MSNTHADAGEIRPYGDRSVTFIRRPSASEIDASRPGHSSSLSAEKSPLIIGGPPLPFTHGFRLTARPPDTPYEHHPHPARPAMRPPDPNGAVRAPQRQRAPDKDLPRGAYPRSPPLRLANVDTTEHTIRVLHGKGNKATTRRYHPSADDALIRWIDTAQLAMGLLADRAAVLHPGRTAHARPATSADLLKRLAAKARSISASTRTAFATHSPSNSGGPGRTSRRSPSRSATRPWP